MKQQLEGNGYFEKRSLPRRTRRETRRRGEGEDEEEEEGGGAERNRSLKAPSPRPGWGLFMDICQGRAI